MAEASPKEQDNSDVDFLTRMRIFGYTREDLKDIVKPMAEDGKICLPTIVIASLNLEKSALIIGVDDMIEIWKPQTYKEFYARHVQGFQKMMRRILN